MCQLRETVSLDLDPSAVILSVQTERKVKRPVAAKWCCRSREGPCWKAGKPPDPRHAAVSRMSHSGTRGTFSKQHQSQQHCTASILHSQSDFLCSALPHHTLVTLGLIILARAEFLFWLVLWGGSSSDSSGTIQQGKAHWEAHDGTDSGGDISGICSVFGLHNAVILRSRCCLTTHNWSAGNSWMLQNKKHVEKSVVCRYTFVSGKKTGQPRKLVKYCSPMS